MARGFISFRVRRALALLLLVAPVLAPLTLAAPPAAIVPLDATEVTAAYLLNFVRFTEWPAAAQPTAPAAPYLIGVSCAGPLLDALIHLVDGQSVRGHPVKVIRIKNAADFTNCHLAYLECDADCGGQLISIQPALNTLRGQPVLTVSSDPGFLSAGGLIQLFPDEGHLRFAIAAEAAHQAGLALNSRLLALARPVPTQP